MNQRVRLGKVDYFGVGDLCPRQSAVGSQRIGQPVSSITGNPEFIEGREPELTPYRSELASKSSKRHIAQNLNPLLSDSLSNPLSRSTSMLVFWRVNVTQNRKSTCLWQKKARISLQTTATSGSGFRAHETHTLHITMFVSSPTSCTN